MSAQINKCLPSPASISCCGVLSFILSPAFFRALSDPNRLAILAILSTSGEPWTVGRVAESFPIDLSVISRHLATLRDAGILSAEKRGREVLYRVRFSELVAQLRGLADAIEACCPPPTKKTAARTEKKPARKPRRQAEKSPVPRRSRKPKT